MSSHSSADLISPTRASSYRGRYINTHTNIHTLYIPVTWLTYKYYDVCVCEACSLFNYFRDRVFFIYLFVFIYYKWFVCILSTVFLFIYWFISKLTSTYRVFLNWFCCFTGHLFSQSECKQPSEISLWRRWSRCAGVHPQTAPASWFTVSIMADAVLQLSINNSSNESPILAIANEQTLWLMVVKCKCCLVYFLLFW